MINIVYISSVKFLCVFSYMILTLTITPINTATAGWSDTGNNVMWKSDKVKKKIVKKKKYYKKRKYSKKKSNKFRSSKLVRSGFTKFKGHRMPSNVANKLRDVESKFGKIRISSSCRQGATVKKTGRPSMHRYCRAVDFNVPRGKYRMVSRYLKSTWGGGVGTYSGRHNHIHIDDHRGRWHN